MFSFVIFSFVITGNINKQMKTKLLKNEEDILFYAWTLKHYINTSSLFLFFSRTQCPTEIVSSQSKNYSCQSLSDDRCLFPALYICRYLLYYPWLIAFACNAKNCNYYSSFFVFPSGPVLWRDCQKMAYTVMDILPFPLK